MTSTPHLHRAAAMLAAGGLAWLAKLAVITATDGAVTSDGFAAVFFVLGVALMSLGLGGVAFAVSAGRSTPVRVASAVGGLLAFFVIFVVLEGIAKSIAGGAGPSWFEDEVGILATGVVLMTAGLLTVRSTTPA